MGLFGKDKTVKIFDKAKRLLDAGKLDKAKAEYEKLAIKGNPYAYTMMALVCMKQAENAKDEDFCYEAIRYLEEAMRLGHKEPESLAVLVIRAEQGARAIKREKAAAKAPKPEEVEKIEEDEEDEEDIIVLSLGDGEELSCSVVGIFTASNDKEYIALLPIEGNDTEEGNVYLYRYGESEDGDAVLYDISDDAEYEIAAEAYNKMQDLQDYDSLLDDVDYFEPSF